MNIAKRSQEFLAGLQNIERAIIDQVRQHGVRVTADNFRWHRGKELLPPPSAIELEIKVASGKTANAVLSCEQAEDSWDRIDRPDVVAMIDAIARDLSS